MRIQLDAARTVGLVLYALVAVVAGQASAGDKPRVVERPVYVDSQAAVWRACEGLPGCEFLPLRGDAGREASEAIFRLSAGIGFPKHWHTSPEHILVMQGRLEMNLENGDRYSIGPHVFLYNPGGMIHWGRCAEGEACVYYVYDDKPYDIHLLE
jgi:quercetin dioxygenase-like cupin family protein